MPAIFVCWFFWNSTFLSSISPQNRTLASSNSLLIISLIPFSSEHSPSIKMLQPNSIRFIILFALFISNSAWTQSTSQIGESYCSRIWFQRHSSGEAWSAPADSGLPRQVFYHSFLRFTSVSVSYILFSYSLNDTSAQATPFPAVKAVPTIRRITENRTKFTVETASRFVKRLKGPIGKNVWAVFWINFFFSYTLLGCVVIRLESNLQGDSGRYQKSGMRVYMIYSIFSAIVIIQANINDQSQER